MCMLEHYNAKPVTPTVGKLSTPINIGQTTGRTIAKVILISRQYKVREHSTMKNSVNISVTVLVYTVC